MRILISVLAAIALLSTSNILGTAAAGADFGNRQLTPKACGVVDDDDGDNDRDREGGRDDVREPSAPVINVTLRLINDADSGFTRPVWAMDQIRRHITVWQVAPGSFCAIVQDEGTFVTLAGLSPNDATITIAAGIKGEIEGGYRATIAGTLKTGVGTHGDLGTKDYACDASGNCPGYFSWVSNFFDWTDFQQPWWGWRYDAGRHGVWINSVDFGPGTGGNIK